MDCIELFPTLEHCIETAAREEFWDSASRYMESGERDSELEQRIQLLKAFLESSDFRKLRSESERLLMTGKTVRFVIRWENDTPTHRILVDEPSEPHTSATH